MKIVKLCLLCGAFFIRVKNKKNYCSLKCKRKRTGIVCGNKTRGVKRNLNKYVINGNECNVYLKNNNYFTIDKKNINTVKVYYWFLSSNGYVIAKKPKYHKNKEETILLHRYIKNIFNKKCLIDHINGNKLNNLEINLRVATRQQNAVNSKLSKNNTCGYRGVRSIKNKYGAYIKYNYKQIHLGSFSDIKDAAIAYNNKAIELFGKFATLNEI